MSISELISTMSSEYDGGTNYIQELAETAAKVALNNFEWRFITFVFFNTTLVHGVEMFLNSYKQSVVVGKGTFYPRYTDNTSQFVLFVDNIQKMETTLDWIKAHQFYNTGKYIIVCQSPKTQECHESQAMQSFWDHRIINVVFLKKENGVAAYTYFPMYDSSCNVNVAVKLNITKLTNLFVRKLRNLNKCKIIVSTFPHLPYMDLTDDKPTGADGDLLNILGEGLNASIKVMTPRIGNGWGKLEDNGSWSGSLADVYYGMANFSMTSAALSSTRFSYFQISNTYYSAKAVWVAHPAVLKPTPLKLLRPFQPTVTLVIATSFFFIILYVFLTKTKLWSSFTDSLKLTRPRRSIVFYSWMICMGLPMTRLPTKTTFAYIVVFWMWYCLLIRTLYQVCLINVLQGKYYYEEFQSINDAVNANYSFGGGATLKNYYIKEPVIYDNWVNVETSDIPTRIINISTGMKFVLATGMETATVVTKDKHLPLHVLPEEIVVTPTVIFFKKFYPLEQSVSYILRRLTESGFYDKFYKKYTTFKTADTEKGYQPIAKEHYITCYEMLLCGWIISTVCFILELYCGKVYKKSTGVKLCP